MSSHFALAAPAALLLLASGAGVAVAEGPISSPPVGHSQSAPQTIATPANPLSAMRSRQVVQQVRIEQRVVIRIAPRLPAARQNLLADLPQRAIPSRFEEKKKRKCVPLDTIAGVQTGSGNRLVLFLRDQQMVSVNLEKSCRARDFYSGFYVEQSEDGRLCVDRDKLQSRTGARCDVEGMRQLVEVGR